ncbi:MAG: class I SAM-dependent methyltransferase, partial [Desulfobacterales bacterium]|nr:class I SAM-dependent methyltransferase [Desulfobacterales bacterium]
MKQWYEELYEDYQAFENEPLAKNTAAEVDFIEQVIDHDQSRRILDVGCGSGRHSLELSRRGYAVVGMDLSESMLERGRKIADAENLKVDFIQRDARRLKIHEGFDVAIMLCEAAFSLMEEDQMDRSILENAFL